MTILQFPTGQHPPPCPKRQGAPGECCKILSDLIDQNSSGTIFLDKNLAVTQWNPEAERIFEYTKQTAVTLAPADHLFAPECRNIFMGQVEALEKGRRTVDFSCDCITGSGRAIVCSWHGYAMTDTKGNMEGFAFLVKDITEGEKIRTLMIQSKKMMCVGGLAGGIAHDIQNALSGLLQAAQLMDMKLNPENPCNSITAKKYGAVLEAPGSHAGNRDVQKYLDIIFTSGRHINDVICNIMDFSREGERKSQPIDMKAVVESTINLVDYIDYLKENPLKNLKILREYDSDLPEITGTPSLIRQVLFNLLKNGVDALNARQFCNDAPRLTVRLKALEKHLCMEVEDNADGMDPDTLARIFTPFYSTKGYAGSGLGLSISLFIITRRFGGQIEAVSQPGKGSCFAVILPTA
nr:ATP-binding protein [uncultured Desulfobacter sp.]